MYIILDVVELLEIQGIEDEFTPRLDPLSSPPFASGFGFGFNEYSLDRT
jgi:hypothetical protein